MAGELLIRKQEKREGKEAGSGTETGLLRRAAQGRTTTHGAERKAQRGGGGRRGREGPTRNHKGVVDLGGTPKGSGEIGKGEGIDNREPGSPPYYI